MAYVTACCDRAGVFGAFRLTHAGESCHNMLHACAQVARLQRELGDAHSADYNTLKRAYVSLVQQFRALQIEAQVKAEMMR